MELITLHEFSTPPTMLSEDGVFFYLALTFEFWARTCGRIYAHDTELGVDLGGES